MQLCAADQHEPATVTGGIYFDGAEASFQPPISGPRPGSVERPSLATVRMGDRYGGHGVAGQSAHARRHRRVVVSLVDGDEGCSRIPVADH